MSSDPTAAVTDHTMSSSKPATGGEHVHAGLALIRWSRLASVDGQVLQAVDAEEFEEHQKAVESQFGRWICWIVFAVGCEYVLKGVSNIRGHLPNSKVGKARLGTMKEPLRRTLADSSMSTPEVDSLVTMLMKAITTFRNRDLHHYRKNVRRGDFLKPQNKIIPALNKYLALSISVEPRCTHVVRPS